MANLSRYAPWHFSNLPTNALLKELLSQIGLPRTASLYAPGTSSDWEQAQFWNQFLRSSTPVLLVDNMKTKVQELGILDMFNEDDYDSIVAAVARYQSQPMGDLQHVGDGEDVYALCTLLLSERVYLEGNWELQLAQNNTRRRSSATRYLWEESAVQLRRRRVSSQTALGSRTQTAFSSMEQTRTTTTINIEPTTSASPGQQARTKDCYFIGLLAFLIVTGSATVGVYFSVAKDRMGDGFTAASYILAAGTLILGPWIATHYQHCNCRRLWSSDSGTLECDVTDIALIPFTRSPTLDAW